MKTIRAGETFRFVRKNPESAYETESEVFITWTPDGWHVYNKA